MSDATLMLNEVTEGEFTLRKFQPEGRDRATWYLNPREGARENVTFQIGSSEHAQSHMPYAVLRPSSFKDTNPKKPSLLLAVPSKEDQAKFISMDNAIAERVQEHGLLGEGKSLEYVKDMQTKMLKHPKKEGGAIAVSLKLNLEDPSSKYYTHIAQLVYTDDGKWAHKQASVDDITPNTILFAITEISPLWFRGKEWGVSLNAKMLLVIECGSSSKSRTPGFVVKGQVVTAAAEEDEAPAAAAAQSSTVAQSEVAAAAGGDAAAAAAATTAPDSPSSRKRGRQSDDGDASAANSGAAAAASHDESSAAGAESQDVEPDAKTHRA